MCVESVKVGEENDDATEKELELMGDYTEKMRSQLKKVKIEESGKRKADKKKANEKKRYCQYWKCESRHIAMPPIRAKWKSGKGRGDWGSRKHHKKCWKEMCRTKMENTDSRSSESDDTDDIEEDDNSEDE